MILHLQRHVHDAISDAVRRRYGLTDLPPFAVEVPPHRMLGDLAVTVAFQLARSLKKPPRAIAQEIAASLASLPGIVRITVAPNGYLNLYLDRHANPATEISLAPSIAARRLRHRRVHDRRYEP